MPVRGTVSGTQRGKPDKSVPIRLLAVIVAPSAINYLAVSHPSRILTLSGMPEGTVTIQAAHRPTSLNLANMHLQPAGDVMDRVQPQSPDDRYDHRGAGIHRSSPGMDARHVPRHHRQRPARSRCGCDLINRLLPLTSRATWGSQEPFDVDLLAANIRAVPGPAYHQRVQQFTA